MAAGDVFKVTLGCRLDAVECRPGFYLVEGGGGGGTDPLLDVALAVEAALDGNPLAGMIQNLSLTDLFITDCQPATASTLQYAIGPYTGNQADDNPPPPQDTMLLTMHTAVKAVVGAYAARGRMYMPGIFSTGQVSGFLTAGLKLALDAFAELLAAPFITDGTAYQMHVVSFNPGSAPRTIRAINPVTVLSTSNRVRSQRRRQAGVGI